MVSESEAALARAVLIYGPTSRSALTKRMGLSPASLTRLAKPLIQGGLLIELEEQPDGSVGRPSRPLDISPSLGSFVGIKLTGSHLYAVLTDARATQVASLDRPLRATDPEVVIEEVVSAVGALAPTNLAAVGISIGGVARSGIVVSARFLGWNDVPLAAPVSARLGVPVTVENDLVALAEAETWFGLGRGIAGFALLTIGAGIGFALVVDGRTVQTRDSGVGTAGHIPLDPFGPPCLLGHRGCSQAMLTSGSIAAQVSAALQRSVGYDEALALAEQEVPAARAVIDAAGDSLGRLIALTANLTLQSTVVLAGEGIPLYDLVRGRVATAIEQLRDPNADPVAIHVDASGFRAWARGAAAIAIQLALSRMSVRDGAGPTYRRLPDDRAG